MTFPANYAVMAEDELTYVTGGGVIADILPPVMTSENWRTFGTNLIKIVGNTFMGNLINVFLGTAFGLSPWSSFGSGMQASVANMDAPNAILQALGGVAAIYTLGGDSAAIFQVKKVVGVDGKVVEA